MSELKFSKSIKRETVYEIAYRELKQAILSNQLDSDKFYTEEEIAKALDISRTPVREAVQSLIDDRLLEVVHRKGVKIRSFSESEIVQIFLLRKAIEKKTLLVFSKTHSLDEINTLKKIIAEQYEAVESENKDLFMEKDQQFHKSIIHYTNYHLVEEVYMKFHDLTFLVGHQAIRKKGRMHEVIKEHEAIIEAIENQDSDRAIKEMLAHLDNTETSYNKIES